MISTMCEEGAKQNGSSQGSLGHCETARHLLEAFGEAVQALVALHEQQFHAIVDGDLDAARFDVLIQDANEKKQNAKYAYLNHLARHGCLLAGDGEVDRRP
jgi:hypothetical protein